MASAAGGDVAALDKFFAAGMSPNTRDDETGDRPLIAASSGGQLEIAQLLLAKGANPDIAKPDGWSPLLAAAQSGHTEMIKSLVAKGADVNAANARWFTPLDGRRQERPR